MSTHVPVADLEDFCRDVFHLSKTHVNRLIQGYELIASLVNEGVKVLPAAEFNCYSVLKQKLLILTQAALDFLRKPAIEKTTTSAAPETEEERVRYGRAPS